MGIEKEALDCTLWRTCFGRDYGTVVRQATKRMYINIFSKYFRMSDDGYPKNKRCHIASFNNVLQISSVLSPLTKNFNLVFPCIIV